MLDKGVKVLPVKVNTGFKGGRSFQLQALKFSMSKAL